MPKAFAERARRMARRILFILILFPITEGHAGRPTEYKTALCTAIDPSARAARSRTGGPAVCQAKPGWRNLADPGVRGAPAELEQRVERRTEELRGAYRELESFSYSVSHDLRAPLRSISGFSQALEEDYGENLDDDGRDYLRRIRASSERMGHIIDDLLFLSRVTRRDLNPEKIDLSLMARQVFENFQKESPNRKVRINIHDDITAVCDTGLMRILMENLLGNAWKYTNKKQEALIEFGRMRDDEGTVYYVRDNGAGFDMKYSRKLFEIFQRLHTQEDFEGNGIGLATVQRILHRHGGRIWAESRPGQGATFYFTLA